MVTWPAWLPNLNVLINKDSINFFLWGRIKCGYTWESRYWTEHTQRELTMAWGLAAHMQSQKVVSLN